jgi:hypothetical protein
MLSVNNSKANRALHRRIWRHATIPTIPSCLPWRAFLALAFSLAVGPPAHVRRSGWQESGRGRRVIWAEPMIVRRDSNLEHHDCLSCLIA